MNFPNCFKILNTCYDDIKTSNSNGFKVAFLQTHAVCNPQITRMRFSIDAFLRINASLTNNVKKHDRMKIRNYSILVFAFFCY